MNNFFTRRNSNCVTSLSLLATLTTGLTLLVPASANAGGMPVDSTQYASANVYPSPEVQAYMDSCVSNATAQGLEQNFAQNYCACTINTFQERYTYAEFTELALSAQTAPQPPSELVEVAELCLYE